MRVSDVSKAIRQNGLPQTTKVFFRDEFNTPLVESYTIDRKSAASACAIGMAAYNLKISPGILQAYLTSLGIGYILTKLNDESGFSFSQIADWLDQWIENYGDHILAG